MNSWDGSDYVEKNLGIIINMFESVDIVWLKVFPSWDFVYNQTFTKMATYCMFRIAKEISW